MPPPGRPPASPADPEHSTVVYVLRIHDARAEARASPDNTSTIGKSTPTDHQEIPGAISVFSWMRCETARRNPSGMYEHFSIRVVYS